MAQATTREPAFLAGLAETERRLAERGPDWLRRLRENGRARFDALGLPTPALEDWKNTNLAPLAGERFLRATSRGVAEDDLPDAARIDLGGPRLVLLDGRLVPELSRGTDGEGVWIGGLARTLEQTPERLASHMAARESESALAALNTALVEDGAVVLIPDGTTLAQPVHVVYLASGSAEPTAVHTRTLVAVGRGSTACVVESYHALADGAGLTNARTELSLGADSRLDHYRLQMENESAYHVSDTLTRQGPDSRLRAFGFDLGGKLVRHDLRAVLAGKGAECSLSGLYVTRGTQHVDNHTTIEHAAPHCDSRELYKGILGGRSRTVFHGRIIVHQDAQKTDARQSNPNVLLSDSALARTRPQLEIYADDVRCTHGATVGRVDEEAVFYLRARGIDEADARGLLVSAFAGQVLEQVTVEPLRERLERTIGDRLAALGR